MALVFMGGKESYLVSVLRACTYQHEYFFVGGFPLSKMETQASLHAEKQKGVLNYLDSS